MKIALKVLLLFILLTSCEAKNLIESSAINEKAAIDFLIRIDAFITKSLKVSDIEAHIKDYFDALEKNNAKTVALEAKLFFASNKDPIIIEWFFDNFCGLFFSNHFLAPSPKGENGLKSPQDSIFEMVPPSGVRGQNRKNDCFHKNCLITNKI